MYGIIYKITNKINGKIYIGQTIRSFKERYDGKIENTKNRHLKRAIEKYGSDAFEVDEQLDTAETKEELDEKEQYYINIYGSDQRDKGYNIMSGGSRGKQAEESKKLISEAQLGEKNHMYGKYGENNPNYSCVKKNCFHCGREIMVQRNRIQRNEYFYCSDYCRKNSTEHLNPKPKIRIKVDCSYCGKEFEKCPSQVKGKKYVYCSKKCQNSHYKLIFNGENNPNYDNHAVSGGNNGRARKVYCITTDEVFPSAVEAGEKYGIKKGLVSACCRGRQKTAGGKKWKYL